MPQPKAGAPLQVRNQPPRGRHQDVHPAAPSAAGPSAAASSATCQQPRLGRQAAAPKGRADGDAQRGAEARGHGKDLGGRIPCGEDHQRPQPRRNPPAHIA